MNLPAPRLFTYTIPINDGAAPNPFRGMCSLAICKPGIRRTAQKGDWVAGLGSKNTQHSGDLSRRLVYAMHVDEVVSLADYDRRAPADWPHRIPNAGSADVTERLGDSTVPTAPIKWISCAMISASPAPAPDFPKRVRVWRSIPTPSMPAAGSERHWRIVTRGATNGKPS
jgi:hypothetical protein